MPDCYNIFPENIKFTMEQHNFYLTFLDNKDYETNNIWVDIFYKKADARGVSVLKTIYLLHLLEEFAL